MTKVSQIARLVLTLVIGVTIVAAPQIVSAWQTDTQGQRAAIELQATSRG